MGGVTFTVPDGWQVVEESDFDPCTATTPTVVLADSLAPSCLVDVGQRAYQPYLWMTTQLLEDRRFRTASGVTLPGKQRQVVGRDGTTLGWSMEMLQIDGTTFQGWLGIPANGGSGRLLLMGVTRASGASQAAEAGGVVLTDRRTTAVDYRTADADLSAVTVSGGSRRITERARAAPARSSTPLMSPTASTARAKASSLSSVAPATR